MNKQKLNKKIDQLPENLIVELNDFVDYLLKKSKNTQKKKARKAGFLKGTFKLTDKFDELLEDFKEYR